MPKKLARKLPMAPAAAECCPSAAGAVPPRTAARTRAVSVFRALGDPSRMDIFALIASRPEAICVCDIVSRFDLRQPTISHHLKVLRDAGLVTATRRGTWAYYAIDRRGAAAARAALDALVPEAARAQP